MDLCVPPGHDGGMTRRRRIGIICGAAGIAAVLTAAVIVRSGLNTAGTAWTVFSAVVAFSTTITGMRLLKLSGPSSDTADLQAALVADVRRQLHDEERRHRINDPWPIPVAMTPADPAISEHWAVIRGDSGLALPPSGDLARIDELFAAVPTRRMVLIGPAGCGKTVAARRLALLHADAWGHGQPVPVLVSLATWKAARQPLRSWLPNQIAEDHPSVAHARELARTLLNTGQLVLILDGFDELPPAARHDALSEINGALPVPQQLVVTSRVAEYTHEVAAADVLTAAAVMHMQPLPADTTFTFLRHATAPEVAKRWKQVQDRCGPGGPRTV
jgi:NACHT domain